MIEARLIRIQGTVFCILCTALLAVNIGLPIQHSLTSLWLIAVAILCLGVPHGAFDPIYAKHQYEPSTKTQWALFVLIYLAIAFAVVAVFLLFPALFLIGFLLLSLLHFSADPESGVKPVFRLVYAGSALILPALNHETQVKALFVYLSTEQAALGISHFLHLLAYPWVLMSLVVVVLHVKTHGKTKLLTSLELFSVALIALLLPPLVSFTVFFCAMHSIRHTLRTRKYSTPPTFKNLLRMATLPILATAFILAGAWYLLDGVAIEARLVQWIFVALAALTVPHMLLVDRLRFQNLEY